MVLPTNGIVELELCELELIGDRADRQLEVLCAITYAGVIFDSEYGHYTMVKLLTKLLEIDRSYYRR